MTDTKKLIARLASEAHKVKQLPPPSYRAICLIAVLVIYGVAIQLALGFRPDLAMQFSRPYFSAETILLSTLLLSSVIAAVVAMAPDSYQKPKLLMLPYGIFLLLVFLLIIQFFLPQDPRIAMPKPGAHAMECALCIAAVSLIPSALIFAFLRNGATVRQSQSGSFAVLAASSLGCLTLRLAEANDSIQHLLLWHYMPTLLFAIIGAYIGKWLLRW